MGEKIVLTSEEFRLVFCSLCWAEASPAHTPMAAEQELELHQEVLWAVANCCHCCEQITFAFWWIVERRKGWEYQLFCGSSEVLREGEGAQHTHTCAFLVWRCPSGGGCVIVALVAKTVHVVTLFSSSIKYELINILFLTTTVVCILFVKRLLLSPSLIFVWNLCSHYLLTKPIQLGHWRHKEKKQQLFGIVTLPQLIYIYSSVL